MMFFELLVQLMQTIISHEYSQTNQRGSDKLTCTLFLDINRDEGEANALARLLNLTFPLEIVASFTYGPNIW